MPTTTLDPPGAVEPSHGKPSLRGPSDRERSDRELLDQMVLDQVAQNRAHAARLDALAMFHRRRVGEREAAPKATAGWFQLTPLRETQAEVAPLTGATEHWVQIELDTTLEVQRWLPRLWQRFVAGRIDLGRATACLDQMQHLATDEARTIFATRMQDWFDKHDPLEESAGALCTLTRQRVQRAAYHQRLRLPQRSDRETFAQAYRKRRVSLRLDEQSGMASLTSTVAAHDALTADHRLTLIAKRRAEAPGETRTLAQLRADSLLDLVHGRITVPATTGDLHHHQGCDRTCRAAGAEPATVDTADAGAAGAAGAAAGNTGSTAVAADAGAVSAADAQACPLHPLVLTTDDGAPLGGYARPVVVVTVPITSLMGLTDQPGVLSGGRPVPAEVARHIAQQPGSTWYRMLTDDRGHFRELSTASYQPTDPIWRTVVTRDHTCVWPSCARPAVGCELDHRVPHPEGATCCHNLAPLCRRHHRVKHADGYGVRRNADGSHTWTTRHGSALENPASEQPVESWPPDTTPGRRSPGEHQAGIHTQEQLDAEFLALTSPLEKAFAALLAGR